MKLFKSQFFNFSFLFFCALFFFSCQNAQPKGNSVQAKFVYDFENETNPPTQKLSFFIELESDSRRVDFINLYHKKTGYRWILDKPLISKVDDKYFAGYTNCVFQPSYDLEKKAFQSFPEGEFDAFYVDAKGQDFFLSFELNYEKNFISENYLQVQKALSNSECEFFLGLYSSDGTLIYYGKPDSSWNFSKENFSYDKNAIFKYNNEVNFFRIFYELKNEIYISPKIEKSK